MKILLITMSSFKIFQFKKVVKSEKKTIEDAISMSRETLVNLAKDNIKHANADSVSPRPLKQ